MKGCGVYICGVILNFSFISDIQIIIPGNRELMPHCSFLLIMNEWLRFIFHLMGCGLWMWYDVTKLKLGLNSGTWLTWQIKEWIKLPELLGESLAKEGIDSIKF